MKTIENRKSVLLRNLKIIVSSLSSCWVVGSGVYYVLKALRRPLICGGTSPSPVQQREREAAVVVARSSLVISGLGRHSFDRSCYVELLPHLESQ